MKKEARGRPLDPNKKFKIIELIMNGDKDTIRIARDVSVSRSTVYAIMHEHPLFCWREKK